MRKFLLLIGLGFCFSTEAQIITTVAGTYTYGYTGDEGQAVAAELNNPYGIVIDGVGNIYISDQNNNRIRKINTAGIISTIAGSGTQGYSGDGGAATLASFYSPEGLSFDGAGNLYIADWYNNVVRMINTAGIINTVAGNGTASYNGDGGAATAAGLNRPSGITFDSESNMYIADEINNVIRRVNTAGIISTFVGNGYAAGTTSGSYGGDGGQATAAGLYYPRGLAFDGIGNMYFADQGNNFIRKVNTSGIISSFAGSGIPANNFGYSGDGGAATAAKLYNPSGLALDGEGNVYIVDSENNVIRKINTAGIISTVVGNGFDAGLGSGGYSGDEGFSTSAELSLPRGLAFDGVGNMYIADYLNNRIRKVSLPLNGVTVNSTTICVGDSTTLMASGATSYTWMPAIGLNIATGANVVANPITPTTYTVIGAKGDSMGLATSIVTVYPLPTITINTATICAGSAAALTASGANTYTWSTGTTGATISQSPTITSNYTVSGVNGVGCLGLATSTVTVVSTPSIAVIATSNTICRGVLDTLIANGATTYSWAPTVGLSISTGAIVIANPTATTAYSVTGTNGGCLAVSTLTIIVSQLPSVPQPLDSTIIYCQGTATYSPINVNGTGVILWSTNPSMNPVINEGNSYTPTTLPLGTTTYYLVDSSIVNGCVNPSVDSVAVTVSVGTVPTVSYLLVPDSVPHVWDLYVYYSANTINAKWYWGDGTDTLAIYPFHNYDSAGTYNICVTVYNACGDSASFCQNDSIYRATSNSMIKVNVIQSTTGINQLSSNNNQISIYPNPNNGSFVIEPKNAITQTMQLYDVNGKLVLSQTINGTTIIDASRLNEGVYNITIINDEGILNKRIVIVR